MRVVAVAVATTLSLFGACGGERVNLGGSPPPASSGGDVGSGGQTSDSPGGAGGGGASLPTLRVEAISAVDEINTPGKEDNVTLTSDELELCFTSDRAGGSGDADVYCATRQANDAPFEAASELVAINSPGFETSVALDLNGLSIWVGSERAGGPGGVDIWRSDRGSRDAAWGMPVLENELNSPADDIPRPPGWGGRVMPLASRRQEGIYWTFFSVRGSDGSFAPPELVGELAEPERVFVDGYLSDNGLLLLYVLATDADGSDIFYSVRAETSDEFSEPIPLDGVNGPTDDRDPWLSPDGRSFYFVSDRDGDFDIYRAKSEIVD